jgi:hypothetical protein
MKERPILFSGAMVRALLAGTKTQTRRVCKPAQFYSLSTVVEVPDPMERGQVYNGSHFGDEEGEVQFASPYGGRGDRLWVKETWRTADTLDTLSPSAIADKCMDAGYSKPWAPLQWEADGRRNREWSGFGPGNGVVVGPGKTRVSIHMPRWASRITLEITSVRVERLQDISEADAMAEGIVECPIPADDEGPRRIGYMVGRDDGKSGLSVRPTQSYRELWESINGPESWAANPWVWAVEFRKVTP